MYSKIVSCLLVSVIIVIIFFLNFLQQWNGHQMFESASDASFFLGVLDTVFMTSYAIVSIYSFFVFLVIYFLMQMCLFEIFVLKIPF